MFCYLSHFQLPDVCYCRTVDASSICWRRCRRGPSAAAIAATLTPSNNSAACRLLLLFVWRRSSLAADVSSCYSRRRCRCRLCCTAPPPLYILIRTIWIEWEGVGTGRGRRGVFLVQSGAPWRSPPQGATPAPLLEYLCTRRRRAPDLYSHNYYSALLISRSFSFLDIWLMIYNL